MSTHEHGSFDELAGVEGELLDYARRTAPDAGPDLLERLELVLAAQLPPAEQPSLVVVKPSTSIAVGMPASAEPRPAGWRAAFASPARLTMRLGLAMGLLALSAVGVFAATGVIPDELLPWNGSTVAAPATAAPTEAPSIEAASPHAVFELPPAPAVDPAVDATDEPGEDPGDDAADADTPSFPTHEGPDAIEDPEGADGGDDGADDGEDGGDSSGSGDGADDGHDGTDGGSDDGPDATDEPSDGGDVSPDGAEDATDQPGD